MKKESEAILLRIFIGEDDKHEGKPLFKFILELFKKEKMAGVTILRGIEGFGKSSHLHTTSILRLSSDLPIVIECVDKKENIEKIKPKLDEIINCGLITEEKVKILLYESNKNLKNKED
jgi:PII-like signaling protein